MTDQNPPAGGGEPDEHAVPWMDPQIQQRIGWRDGDIVISVPVKSGTTWTMNIVHQLREGGDLDLGDVYVEVPWLEFVPGPDVDRDALVARYDAMPSHRRRAFKTHSPAGPLPYQAPGDGPDVKYLVVVRHPEEAIASMYPFLAAHAEEWFELWGMDKAEMLPPDFAAFFETGAQPMIRDMLFGFVDAWWPLRHAPNVKFLHFSDMKRDHEGSIRAIAEFLGFEPTEAEWPVILECTSFEWMKRNEDRFEGRGMTTGTPVLEPGAMMRKGKTGAAREDGVTPEISAEIERIGREVVKDKAALDWALRGGALP
jgi:aryl sulfotransferase